MDPQISLFSNFFIKNRFHGTIYTFKNYFATVFFSFQFSTISKQTPNLSWREMCKGYFVLFVKISTSTATFLSPYNVGFTPIKLVKYLTMKFLNRHLMMLVNTSHMTLSLLAFFIQRRGRGLLLFLSFFLFFSSFFFLSISHDKMG